MQYELKHNQIEYQEDYTATGVQINACLQVHQIEPLKIKLQDVTRGREAIKIMEDSHD